MDTIRCCARCRATDNLRLMESLTVWNEGQTAPRQVNIYVCVDRRACSERVNEAGHFMKEEALWKNYKKENHRPRRYTPRRYWHEGRRLTFAIAEKLFRKVGMTLEKGRPDFPEGLKSGYIVNHQWRFTSLLDAVKLIEHGQRMIKKEMLELYQYQYKHKRGEKGK